MQRAKQELTNFASSALIREPKYFKQDDPTKFELLELVRKVIAFDPEFILKLALYVRKELNVRSTANFLVAVAADSPNVSRYLRKYYSAIISLPSDFLEVAIFYQALGPEAKLQGGALPAILRRVMVQKFAEFNEYSLAKYNKTKKKKKKVLTESEKIEMLKRGQRVASEKPELTLKQMIRQLHISEPKEYVMSIIGKKYPATETEFFREGLPGEFDPERAGKRMKLTTPITWETQLSEKGNRAESWEQLMDDKALPFMAMMRNIRNVIVTGVAERYHTQIQRRLTHENQVINSRQFPFRFFSAYEAVLEGWQLISATEDEDASKPAESGRGRGRGRGRGGRGGGRGGEGGRKKIKVDPKHVVSYSTILKYLDSLDAAVKIATMHNVKPIGGTTVVFCNVGEGLRNASPNARSLGGKVKKLNEMGVLLGLMCCYMCEECYLYLYNVNDGQYPDKYTSPHLVPFDSERNLLDQLEEYSNADLRKGNFPFKTLERFLLDRKSIDNLIFFSDEAIGGAQEVNEFDPEIRKFLKRYRTMVNKDMLFVSCNLAARFLNISSKPDSEDEYDSRLFDESGSQSDSEEDSEEDQYERDDKKELDIFLNGFSDAILRFISERGDQNQLSFIENIDKKYNLMLPTRKRKRDASSGGSMFSGSYESGSGGSLGSFGGFGGFGSFGSSAGSSDSTAEEMVIYRPIGKVSAPITPKPMEWQPLPFFITSTFLDMHGERDFVKLFVFPRVNQLLRERMFKVTFTDLRWGVTASEAQNNLTLEICLKEIERCKPNVIGFLGRRYGWVPTEHKLPLGKEYDAIRDKDLSEMSVTEIEMRFASLWEAKPSASGLFYLRDDDSPLYESMTPEETAAFVEEDEGRSKRLLALRDEIKASSFYRMYKAEKADGDKEDGPPTASVSALRKELQHTITNDVQNHILSTFVNQGRDDAMLSISERNFTAVERLRLPHDMLLDERGAGFVGRKETLESLMGYVRFTSGQARPLSLVLGGSGAGKTSLLAKAVSSFVEAQHSGRTKAYNDVLLLYHFVGSGRGTEAVQTMLYRFTAQIMEAVSSTSEDIGISFDYTSPYDLKYSELIGIFGKALKAAVRSCRVVFVVDSVDELVPQRNALSWLPGAFPSTAVHAIFSANPDTQVGKALSKASRAGSMMSDDFGMTSTGGGGGDAIVASSLPRMDVVALPLLSSEERKEVVRTSLAKHNKRLEEDWKNDQMRLLIQKRDAGMPLYLVVACEELRLFSEFEKLTSKIEKLPATLGKLLRETLSRFEDDFGEALISHSFSAIAESRVGILTSEILELCSLDIPGKDIESLWYGLQANLDFFLLPTLLTGKAEDQEGNSLLFFRYDSVRKAVRERYLSTDASLMSVHEELAVYFFTKCDPLQNLSFRTSKGNPVPRPLSQVVHHAIRARQVQILRLALCSLSFISAFSSIGQAHLLITYYDEAIELCSTAAASASAVRRAESWKKLRSDLEEFRTFILQNVDLISKTPELLFQQAANQPDDTFPARMARQSESAVHVNWLRWLNKPQEVSPNILTLSEPVEVLAVAISEPKQTGSSTLFGDSAKPSQGRKIAVATKSCEIRIFDAATGEEEEVEMTSHSNWVVALSFSPDGSMLASASYDCDVRLWSVEEGWKDIGIVTTHRRKATSVYFSLDGKKIVSAGQDIDLHISSAFDAGKKIRDDRISRVHTKPVNAVAFSADGRMLASGSWDSSVAVVDFQKKKVFRKLKASVGGHSKSITSVAFVPSVGGDMEASEAYRLASASLDGSVLIWDVSSGVPIVAMRDHGGSPVAGVAFSADGSILTSVGYDKRIVLYGSSLGRKSNQVSPEDSESGEIGGGVTTLALAGTEGLVAVGDEGHHLRLMKIAEGERRVISTTKYECRVRFLDFSAAETRLAIALEDLKGTIEVANVNERTRDVIQIFHRSQLNAQITAIKFSNGKSKMLAVATADYNVRLLGFDTKSDMEGGPNEVCKLSGVFTSHVTSLAWHEANRLLFAGCNNGELVPVTLVSSSASIEHQFHETIEAHSSSIEAMDVVDNLLVTASSDMQIATFEVVLDGGSNPKLSAVDHLLRFSASDSVLAVRAIGESAVATLESGRGGVRLYSRISGSFLSKIEIPEGEQPTALTCAKSFGRALAAIGMSNGSVSLIHPLEMEIKRVFDGHSDALSCVSVLNGVGLSEDMQNVVVSAGTDKTIRLWKTSGAVEEREVRHSFSRTESGTLKRGESARDDDSETVMHVGRITGLEFVAGTKLALSAGVDGYLRLTDYEQRKVLWQTSSNVLRESKAAKPSPITCMDALGLSTSLNDANMIVGLETGEAIVFALDTARYKFKKLKSHQRSKNICAVAMGYRHAVAASWDETISTFSIQDEARVTSVGGGKSIVKDWTQALLMSVENWDHLFLGSNDCSVMEYDVVDKKPHARFQNHDGWVTTLGFCDEKRLLASAGRESVILTWDIRRKWRVTNRVIAHDSAINKVAFDGGNILISGGEDRFVKVWDLRKMKSGPITMFKLNSAVSALSCNSGRLIVGDTMGKLYFFDSEF